MDQEERLKAAHADRYRVEREIGAGGMATVYLAEDLKHHRKVAVKVLNPDLAQTLGAERFLREIETVANLRHPNVLPLFDSGEADSFLFYVMPYVKGESLRARLTREKQLPVEDAIQITREIADALAYAHEEGVIHRDVNPANIMLEAGHAVLADFGVAHAVAEAKDERLTRTGMSLGTPAYMSPEQATGEQDLDGRSDQYALGCVLFEMLSGDAPYLASTFQAVLAKKLSDPVPRISVVRESVPASVEAALTRALAKNPVDRFKSTGEMAAAFALTTAPATAETLKGAKSLRISLGVAVLVVIGLLGTMVLRPGEEAPSDSAVVVEDDRPSIAVLPFQNHSGLKEDVHFTDGMQDQLITQLTKLHGLSVICLTSVLALPAGQATMPEIGEELNVQFLIEGGVQRAGGMLRITIQLIEAAEDHYIWADFFDRSLSTENIFEIQTEIVEAVAERVQALVTPEEQARIASVPTQSLEAFDLYLSGRHRFRSRSSANIREAVRSYEAAIDQDSTFALAWAGIATAWTILPFYESLPSREAYDRGQEAALRALELDDGLAEAHAVLGALALYHEWDWASAEEHLLRAIELDRNYPETYLWLGTVQCILGRSELGVQSLREGVRLNPLAGNFQNVLGFTLNNAGRVEEALTFYFGESGEKYRSDPLLLPTLIQQGSDERAVGVLRRWGERAGYSHPERLDLVIEAIRAPELNEEALIVVGDLEDSTAVPGTPMAVLYYLLDAPTELLRSVQKAITDREVAFVLFPGALGPENLERYPEVVAALEAAGFPVLFQNPARR